MFSKLLYLKIFFFIIFSFMISCNRTNHNSNALSNNSKEEIGDKSILIIDYKKNSVLNHFMVKPELDQKIEFLESIKLNHTKITSRFKKIDTILNDYILKEISHIIKQYCFGEQYNKFDFKKNMNLETVYVMSITSKKDIFDFVFLDDIQACFCKISNFELPEYIVTKDYNFGWSTNFLRIESVENEKFPEELDQYNIGKYLEKGVANKITNEYSNDNNIKFLLKTSVYRFLNKEGLFFVSKGNTSYPLYLRTRNQFHPLCKEVISYPYPKSINSYCSFLFNLGVEPLGPELLLLIPNFFSYFVCRSFLDNRTKLRVAYADPLLDNNVENLRNEDIWNLQNQQRRNLWKNDRNIDLEKFKKVHEISDQDGLETSLFKLTLVYFKNQKKLDKVEYKNSKFYLDDMKTKQDKLNFQRERERHSMMRFIIKHCLKYAIIISFTSITANIFLKKKGYLKKGNDYIQVTIQIPCLNKMYDFFKCRTKFLYNLKDIL